MEGAGCSEKFATTYKTTRFIIVKRAVQIYTAMNMADLSVYFFLFLSLFPFVQIPMSLLRKVE
jgi:hypothetical protein